MSELVCPFKSLITMIVNGVSCKVKLSEHTNSWVSITKENTQMRNAKYSSWKQLIPENF